ncbi:MAG: glutathione S-transferase family protein, partial [Litoreibacter sp.]|nr:glutathione S-transferase family protein [Litoreibacter sp.]
GHLKDLEIVFSVGSPVDSSQMPTSLNPLGKIPALVLENGKTLFDSRVICRYLDEMAGNRYYPKSDLYDVLTLEALADGIMDAAILMIYEVRCRDDGERSEAWVEGQWAKVVRALDRLEAEGVTGTINMGQIALGCALGYLDFRHQDRNWRENRPTLAAWFEGFSKRMSMAETVPHA